MVNNIVITIPIIRLSEIGVEEDQQTRHIIKLKKSEWVYQWKLPSYPKNKNIERAYFLWNYAVRSYYKVLYVTDPMIGVSGPCVVLDPEVHLIDPIPMKPFRGFKYFYHQVHEPGCRMYCAECI